MEKKEKDMIDLEVLRVQIYNWVSNVNVADDIWGKVNKELDKAMEEGRQVAVAGLSISENMEKVERFFRECPIDYDDKCNMWFEFLDKLLKE